MRKLILLALVLAIFTSTELFGQFRLASDGFVSQVSNPNDSTYIVDVNIFSDRTGTGYVPTAITTAYRVFSQRGQLYRISATASLTFSSARLTLIEIDNDQVNTDGLPIGQIQIFDPTTVEAIPQVPFGTTGATSVLQAAVVSYNSIIPSESESQVRVIVSDSIEEVRKEIPVYQIKEISSDGYGGGINSPNFNNISFTQVPLNSDGTLVGEVSLGLVSAGNYLFTVPQDADNISRLNTNNLKIDKIPSVYRRLLNPNGADGLRDKFNGAAHDGEYIWIVPSWAEMALKIHPDTLSVIDEIPINTYGDDAYNGAVYSGVSGKVFFVPHDSPVLKWIDVNTGTIGQNDLSAISGISIGTRSFMSGCFTGESVFLYPRSSTKLLEIDPFTGNVIAEYIHPLSNTTPEAAGWFHGGSFDGRYINLNPFGTTELVRFDTKLKTFTSQPHNLSGSAPWAVSSVYVDGFVFFPSLAGSDAIVLNTFTGIASTVSTDLPEGESGAIQYSDGTLWIASAQSDNIYYSVITDDKSFSKRADFGDIKVSGNVIGDSLFVESLQSKSANFVGTNILADYYEYLSDGQNIQITDTSFSTGDGFLFDNTDRIVAQGSYNAISGGGIFFEIDGQTGTWDNGRVFSTSTGPTANDGIQVFMSEDRLVVRGTGGTSVMPTGYIPSGTSRVGIRFNSTSIFMYVDGVQVYTESMDMRIPANSLPVSIGNMTDETRPLLATLREVLVFDSDPGAASAIDFTNAYVGEYYPSARYYFNFTSVAKNKGGQLRISVPIVDIDGNLGSANQVLKSDPDGIFRWANDGTGTDNQTLSFDADSRALTIDGGNSVTMLDPYASSKFMTSSSESYDTFDTPESGGVIISGAAPQGPGGTSFFLLEVKVSTNGVVRQIAFGYNNIIVHTRFRFGGIWSAWSRMDNTDIRHAATTNATIDYDSIYAGEETEGIILTLAGSSSANAPPEAKLFYVENIPYDVNVPYADQNLVQYAHPYNGFSSYLRRKFSGVFSTWAKIWNSENDGSGSGLDADLLDGQEGSYYYSPANLPTLQEVTDEGASTTATMSVGGLSVDNDSSTAGTFSEIKLNKANDGHYLRNVFNANNNVDFTIGKYLSNAADADRLTILDNGKVGIGTSLPAEQLDVNGAVRVQDTNKGASVSLIGRTGDGTLTDASSITTANNYLAGRLAVGKIVTPFTALDVWYDSPDLDVSDGLRVNNDNNTAGSFSQIILKNAPSTIADGYYLRSVLNSNTDVDFRIGRFLSNGVDSDRLTILNNGNVGIGTTNPLSKLHIGDAHSPSYSNNLLVAGTDAVAELSSTPAGTYGSAMILSEYNLTTGFENSWSMLRETSGAGNDLQFRFGANSSYFTNSVIFTLRESGDALISGNMTVGNVNATAFIGDGSQLTNLPVDGPTRVTSTSNLTRTSASVASDAALTASIGVGLYKYKAVLVYRGSDVDTDLEYEIERQYVVADFSMSRSNDATSVVGQQGLPYVADVTTTSSTATHTVIIEGTFYSTVSNEIRIDWGGTDAVGSITMVRGSYLEIEKID